MSFFISFEGIDGCGKTTQVELLRARLQNAGALVRVTREPGGTALAEAIRGYLLDAQGELSPRTELLLFAAARAQHVEQLIRPALERSEIVLCDRFTDSTAAYQGGGLGLGADFITSLNIFASQGILPDVTFLLDIDPQVGFKRRCEQRGIEDRIEQRGLDFQCKVRESFLEIAREHSKRVILLNASDPAKVIHNKIVRVLEQREVFNF